MISKVSKGASNLQNSSLKFSPREESLVQMCRFPDAISSVQLSNSHVFLMQMDQEPHLESTVSNIGR